MKIFKRSPKQLSLLCLQCTLIRPDGNQRRPIEGEQCEVCGKPGPA